MTDKKCIQWKTVFKKLFILLGTNVLAGLSSGVVGCIVWLDLFNSSKPITLIITSAALQFMGVVMMFDGNLYVKMPIFITLVGLVIASVILYWKYVRKWYLLLYAIPVACFTLCGAKALADILAR